MTVKRALFLITTLLLSFWVTVIFINQLSSPILAASHKLITIKPNEQQVEVSVDLINYELIKQIGESLIMYNNR